MGELADILLPTGPSPQGAFYWATVTSADPLQVRLDGETVPLNIKPQTLVAGLQVGDRVWCQLNKRQLLIIKANTDTRRIYIPNAARLMTGGGVRKAYDANTIQWSQRFLAGMGAGRGSDSALSGYFNVEQPPSGTVIPVYGSSSATSATVTANGVPLINWQILWYEPPLGGGEVSDPSRFRITGYTKNFEVPDTWIPLVTKNGDTGTFFWFDGKETAPWILPGLGGGWAVYGLGYSTPGYKKENGIVYLQGLIKSGTAGSTNTIFQLPVGSRPSGGTKIYLQQASGGVADVRIATNGAVYVSGYYASGTNADVSLDGIVMPVDQ